MPGRWRVVRTVSGVWAMICVPSTRASIWGWSSVLPVAISPPSVHRSQLRGVATFLAQAVCCVAWVCVLATNIYDVDSGVRRSNYFVAMKKSTATTAAASTDALAGLEKDETVHRRHGGVAQVLVEHAPV